jgi:hypothetical protein
MREVGDLKRDRDQACHRGRVERCGLEEPVRLGGAEGPQRRPDRAERSADARGCGPDQQRVADVEAAKPDRQLAEQDDRRLGRQDPVAPPVAGHRIGDQPEEAVHGTGHQARQPASGAARHDDGSNDTYRGAQHEYGSGSRRDIACGDRSYHPLSLVNRHVSPCKRSAGSVLGWLTAIRPRAGCSG